MDARVNDEPPFAADREADPDRPAPRRPSVLSRIGRGLRLLVMVILPIALIVGALAGFGWMRATKPTVPVERQGEVARPIAAIVADPGPVQPTLTVYGRIVSGRSVDIRALVSGPIVSVSDALVDGGRVAAGDPLVTIDPFAYEGALVRANADLAEAQARIAELEARTRQETDAIERARDQLVIAERDLDRISTLRDSGSASARALDDVELRVSQARAALETRENQLAIYEAQRAALDASLDRLLFAVSQAERNLADTVLRAPFDALVSDVGAEVGKVVSLNDRIATLVATERLEARFLLSDAQYARLAPDGGLVGRPVTVIWSAGESEIRRAATITRVASAAQDASFAVYASFDEAADAEVLRPGAFVEARLADRVYENALTLPVTALYDGGVFTVDGESRLARVPVEILAWGEDEAVVRAPEIAAGTTILASRLTAAGAGQLVEIRTPAADAEVGR
ncbi:efflux RND transporter periplasmic adaptor subunit [Salinarimonas ramus]|uniref:Secretion protein HlyD n=1 Tax=Salinarimonas ramus TaxID=690164 RepID=A0A917V7U0_9HYPH|nr:HlyD family efflux transporter periplasmic adaptor subunit [Salinarimonas ramus]GGK48500.1 secretion protein HlyD [Salinarimonas ramus]